LDKLQLQLLDLYPFNDITTTDASASNNMAY